MDYIKLFFSCFEFLISHNRLLINKTPSSVRVFPQRPEGDVVVIIA